ncbi:amino acid ABC transporter substrate-binding protein, PAAT family [Halopseudomonas xinjiangensis]|uniref:Amino acid ABC transporter substrate-binding protein, PAAT family n=1 Tax=Halopseudomonas xinjiangensis TaxID=487184 RepID=A0A1H1L524_9GAMM|nr:transporter substrate-binding domain-containing protein [Halopseudomonas xinjiangensis]SDR69125.1 amino acid ABC transporter substrate-binding protein, PAAT family [Halopseudomonas xinjiangensis]
MKLTGCLLTICLIYSASSLADALRVVSEPWPPYVFEDRSGPAGVDLEVAGHVLRALGHEVTWDLLPWKRALRTVEFGDAQAILDIVPTAQRIEALYFPDEHLSTNDTVLFYHRDRPHPFDSLADLSGLTIGVAPGYTYSSAEFTEATHFIREPAPSFEANLLKLIRGRLDMVAMDRRVGLYLAQQLGIADQLAHHSTALSSGKLYLAFHRSDSLEKLAQSFGPALRAFKQTAEYAAILQRYGEAVDAGAQGTVLP